jgi:hypothetical protein
VILKCYLFFSNRVRQSGDSTWNGRPLGFAYENPYLFVVHTDSVEVIYRKRATSASGTPDVSTDGVIIVAAAKSLHVFKCHASSTSQ